jgi:hypothetical protein
VGLKFKSQSGIVPPVPGCSPKLNGSKSLVPAAKRPSETARSMLIIKFGKNMSMNKFEHLMKYFVTMCHNPNSPRLINGLYQIHCIKLLEFSDFILSVYQIALSSTKKNLDFC